MSTEVVASKFKEWKLAGASKGVSLSTTAAFTPLPFGTQFISMVGRNYSTAVVARVLLNPWLTVLKSTDLLTTTTNITDYSEAAQDGDTATDVVLSSLTTLNGVLLIGAEVPFAGVVIDVDGTNSTGSTALTVFYWDGTQWSDISATDGTSGTVSLDQDGSVTWTVPADWTSTTLFPNFDSFSSLSTPSTGLTVEPKYWTVFNWDHDLDSSTTLNSITAINRSTAYAELIASVPWEQGVKVGPGGVSAVQALTDAGTANLIINCATAGRFS